MRRSMIWIAWSTAWRTRSTIAGSVMVIWRRPPPWLEISSVRWPAPPRMPPSGCESSRTLVSAVCKSLSRTTTSTLVPRTTGALERPTRASRSTRRTSSRSCSSFSLRTAPVSTSSRRCEPPCRSRPSTTCRCAHFGQACTVFSAKKFGTASMHTNNAVSRMPNAFQREMYIMSGDRPGWCLAEACENPLALRAVVLDRLALGAHARDHRADLSHAHAIGNLNLDLLLIDDLGDLADQPSRRNHRIAAAQVLHQVLVLLHPLLLGPQDQEVHQGNDGDHHHERRRQQAVAERAATGLRKSGRHEHRHSPEVSVGRYRRFSIAARSPIGADYTGERPNCNAGSGL